MNEDIDTEYAWVIDRYHTDELVFWTGAVPAVVTSQGIRSEWSNKHVDAIRFARKRDADRILLILCDGVGRSAQHGWVKR